jgi:hypothetical protein
LSLAIDLIGFVTVASDILAGLTEEISNTFEENVTTYWDLYDTITTA